MDSVIKKYLSALEFGEVQHFGNMGVLPLMCSLNHSPEYLTLKEALEKQILKIGEVSEGGSVPELRVNNTGEIPILLLDGEEVVGAKQNRVLNTSILLKEKSETVIPVSCTERGRWAYTSRESKDSGTVMSSKIRRVKAQTVSDSLEESKEYRSDQGTVWKEIEKMAEKADARSETGAMRTVFEAKMKDLDDYLRAFGYLSGQKGILTFIGGEVAGLDFVSLDKAYSMLHPKLIKSYAIDALLMDKKNGGPSIDKAKVFVAQAVKCKEKKYQSVGEGWDHRFEGDSLVGSALKFGKKVIHMAFFAVTESEKTGDMAGFRRRTRFRTN